MAHFGILVPDASGHLNPMTGLGRELKRRGHRVSVFIPPDTVPRIEAAGLESALIGQERWPPGTTERLIANVSSRTGLPAMMATFSAIRAWLAIVLDELPEALPRHGIDLMIVDEAAPGGGSVCDLLGTPWVQVANAASILADPVSTPPFLPWGPATGALSRLRNRAIWRGIWLVGLPLVRDLDRWRAARGMPGLGMTMERPRLAHIHQEPAPFTWPRGIADPILHFLGPLHDPQGRRPVPFPWERLDGRPLVYASLGTVQTGNLEPYRAIAEAVATLPVQLVLSLGGSAEPEVLGQLPGDPIVVRAAPQLELLDRAALMITHAGMNSALECLSRGVPTVAMPVANDQPGVAARLERCGAGLRVSLRARPATIRAAVERVLADPSFKAASGRMAAHIAATLPRQRAADVIEEALRTGKPVQAPAPPGQPLLAPGVPS